MRNYFFVILMILTIEPYAQTACAQPGEPKPFYFGTSLSYVMESIDTDTIKEKFSQPVDVSFDNVFGVQLRGGMELNEYLFGELMFEYISPFEDSESDKTSEIGVMDLGVNLKTILAYTDFLEPYALVGLGIVRSTRDITYDDDSFSSTDWGLDFRLGIGMDLILTPDIFLGLETAYIIGTGGADYVRYSNLSFLLGYRF